MSGTHPTASADGGSCCSRFCADITGTCRCAPNFRTVDPNSKIIDVPASFSPTGTFALVWKVATVIVGLVTFALGFFQDFEPIYFGFLTNWGVVLVNLYAIMSLYNYFRPVPSPEPGTTTVSGRVKLTWILFILAAHLELVVTLMYWPIIYNGNLKVINIFSHGIAGMFVIVDGLFVNTIPVRLRHWIELPTVLLVLYLVWSVLHSPLVFAIGNPRKSDDDPDTNDDLIYTVMDWKDDPVQTATLTFVILLIASPGLYLILWCVSSYRRRYDADPDNIQSYDKSSAQDGFDNMTSDVEGTEEGRGPRDMVLY